MERKAAVMISFSKMPLVALIKFSKIYRSTLQCQLDSWFGLEFSVSTLNFPPKQLGDEKIQNIFENLIFKKP